MKYKILLLCLTVNQIVSSERSRALQLSRKRRAPEAEAQRAFKRKRAEKKQGALHRAIRDRASIKIEELLKPKKGPGANPNRPDELGMTPAHYAVEARKPFYLTLLKRENTYYKPFNPSLKDDKGNTPLHLACSLGYQRCAIRLLELGAQLEIYNNAGQTPLQIAELAGSLNCKKALEEFKAKKSLGSRADIAAALQERDAGEAARSAAEAQKEKKDVCMICQDDEVEDPVFLFSCKHSVCYDCSQGQARSYLECFTCKAKIKKELTFEERLALQEAEKARQKKADEEASEAEVLRLLALEYRHIE